MYIIIICKLVMYGTILRNVTKTYNIYKIHVSFQAWAVTFGWAWADLNLLNIYTSYIPIVIHFLTI